MSALAAVAEIFSYLIAWWGHSIEITLLICSEFHIVYQITVHSFVILFCDVLLNCNVPIVHAVYSECLEVLDSIGLVSVVALVSPLENIFNIN